MDIDTLNDLRSRSLLLDAQYTQLEKVITKKTFSVFFELRAILYTGVLLFAGGIGLLVYKNIGDLGHLLTIGVLCALTIACFTYAFFHALPYSNDRVNDARPYFDYIVLLGSLLFATSLGYIDYRFPVFDAFIPTTTLIAALCYFFIAYRFDHLGILSLGIAALASFVGMQTSLKFFWDRESMTFENLHITAITFAASLGIVATLLDKRRLKPHFTFTYLNFTCLIFLSGALAGVFLNKIFLLVLFIGCACAVVLANTRKSFLFLLYAFIYGYIGVTYILADTVLRDPWLWCFYLIASCGGFASFIIRYRTHFRRDP